MKIKTSELTGAALDWAVASAAGYLTGGHFHYRECRRVELRGRVLIDWAATRVTDDDLTVWNPTGDWAQGGPIIEQGTISVIAYGGEWRATNGDQVTEEAYSFAPLQRNASGTFQTMQGYADEAGGTPLIAAMRCFVASKLGDEVEIPDELL